MISLSCTIHLIFKVLLILKYSKYLVPTTLKLYLKSKILKVNQVMMAVMMTILQLNWTPQILKIKPKRMKTAALMKLRRLIPCENFWLTLGNFYKDKYFKL